MHASLGAIGRLGTVDDDEPPIDEKDEINDSLDDIKDDGNKRSNPWQRSVCDYYGIFTSDSFNEIKNHYKISRYLPFVTICNKNLKSNSSVNKDITIFNDVIRTTSLLRIFSDYIICYSYNEIKALYSEMFEVSSNFTRIISQDSHYPRENYEWMSQLRCFSFVGLEIPPLNNLRSMCEVVRDYMCEMSSSFRRLSHVTSNLDYALSSLFSDIIDPREKLFNRITYYSNFITLLGHYLVYASMVRLSNLDVNRSTHQELWDMSRGIEELNILTNQLKEIRMKYKKNYLYSESAKENFDYCSQLTLEDIIVQLANFRANHLVHIIKEQVIFSPSFVHFIRYGSVSGYDTFEEHHNYLLKSSHLMSADYLRNEYEFSSAILDIFSQSTELFKELRNSMFYQEKNQLKGKGDLSELKEKNKTNLMEKKNIYSESSWNTKLFYSYSMEDSKEIQTTCIDETRHSIRRRMSTFNSPKKIRTEGASGFVLSDRQLTSVDFDYDLTLEEFNKDFTNRRFSQRTNKSSSHCREKLSKLNESEENRSNNTSPRKKIVQWSDFEEVPLRHQAVGRYLELVWRNVSYKILHEWINPYPSRTQKKGFGENCGFFIKSLSKQLSNSSEMDSQGYLSTTILFFENEQLHRFSEFISIISRSEIFPTGLLPILNHQSAQISSLADRADFIKYSYPKVFLPKNPNNTAFSEGKTEIDLLRQLDPQTKHNFFRTEKNTDTFIEKHFIFSLKLIRKIAAIVDCHPEELTQIDLFLKKFNYRNKFNEFDMIHLGSLSQLISSVKLIVIRIVSFIKNYIPTLFLTSNNPNCLEYIEVMLVRYKSLILLEYLTNLHTILVERILYNWNKMSGWMEKPDLRKMVSNFPHDDKKISMSVQLTSSIVTRNLQHIAHHLNSLKMTIQSYEKLLLTNFQLDCLSLMEVDLKRHLQTDKMNVDEFTFISLKYFTEMNQIIFNFYSFPTEYHMVSHEELSQQILLIIFNSFFHHWTNCIENIRKIKNYPINDLIPIQKLENILQAFEIDQKIPELTRCCRKYAILKSIVEPMKD